MTPVFPKRIRLFFRDDSFLLSLEGELEVASSFSSGISEDEQKWLWNCYPWKFTFSTDNFTTANYISHPALDTSNLQFTTCLTLFSNPEIFEHWATSPTISFDIQASLKPVRFLFQPPKWHAWHLFYQYMFATHNEYMIIHNEYWYIFISHFTSFCLLSLHL